MANQFASGKHAIAECDVCGFRYKLKQLKPLVVKGSVTRILACPACWVPDHPQLHLGEQPIYDPQAIRDPRPDRSYDQSRDISWEWNPVGTPDAGVGETGDVDAGETDPDVDTGLYLEAEAGGYILLEDGSRLDMA